jgi:hypothetical protein
MTLVLKWVPLSSPNEIQQAAGNRIKYLTNLTKQLNHKPSNSKLTLKENCFVNILMALAA